MGAVRHKRIAALRPRQRRPLNALAFGNNGVVSTTCAPYAFAWCLAKVKTMTEQAREAQGGGTWGPREAAAEWRRGAAARVQAFGPATDLMLDLVKLAAGSRVLDVGRAREIPH